MVYAIWCWMRNHLHHKVENRNVLIIFQQVYGDSVLLVPLLKGFVELYPRALGYRVTLLCRPSISKFLSEVASIPEELIIETMDYSRFLYDFCYFKDVVAHYRYSSGVSIVTGTSISAEILSCTICSHKRYGLISGVQRTHPRIMVLFQQIAYTNPIIADVGVSHIMQKKLLMRRLGLNNYKGRLTRLLPQERVISGNYCVVCPGASVSVKMWPIDRFVSVIEYILGKYDMDVYLCGGVGEEYLGELIVSSVSFPERVHNKIGGTTFKEWASIIEYSAFVLGNDSASVHIGVAYQKRVICINGLYEKDIMYPYQVDELESDEALPDVVSLDSMSCACCITKGYFAGYGNTACRHSIKAGRCALCIDAVTVEMVKEKIEFL